MGTAGTITFSIVNTCIKFAQIPGQIRHGIQDMHIKKHILIINAKCSDF